MNLPDLENCEIAVIGMGYVGLPLAVQIALTETNFVNKKKLKRKVIGFDINQKRLKELLDNFDRTGEVTKENLIKSKNLIFTDQYEKLKRADVFIVTVPTPIDSINKPDLSFLESATISIGKALLSSKSKSKPVVIYESTVFPGATDEFCIPIIENISGRKLNEGFVCGYSPERINPGDKNHLLTDIVKVTSGSSVLASNWIEQFYSSFIKAGTYQAPSIKVAEAAKVIENTQRDLNIALINEIAIIFSKMGIDTLDVLEAANTKWNFLDFKPGLVGGHCIGVDPYYLTYKSQKLGYTPKVLLAGRTINDNMSNWLAQELLLEMSSRNVPICSSNVLIMGLTFKENCSDTRNTKITNIINLLEKYNASVCVLDPIVDQNDPTISNMKNIHKVLPNNIKFDSILVAVAHDQFKEWQIEEWLALKKDKRSFIFDLKGIVPSELGPIRI